MATNCFICNIKHATLTTALPVRNTALAIQPSGRAADFLTPHFVRGCAGACRLAYCHVNEALGGRVEASGNVEEILQAIHRHACAQPWPRLANRSDERYYTYDFAPNTDVGLHYEATDWARVIRFFSEHPRAKGAFSLKYVREDLWRDLRVAPGKVRVRLSLLPESTRRILEPTAPSVSERLAAIPLLREAGYEVDLNFSPLICYEGWLDDYAALFALVAYAVPDELRAGMQYEANLLSHRPLSRERNLASGRTEAERLLYNADLQELVGAGAPHQLLRYRYELRRGILREWRDLAAQMLPWLDARYVG